MINWSQVGRLRDEVGSEDFDEVVELFLEEVEEVVNRLRKGTQTANLEADLHFLKGSAMNLGFDDFSELCQKGENLAATGQAHEVNVGAILTSYDASRSAFMIELMDQLSA